MGDAASEPLISVIVPVYKVEPYLRKCVDSILAQTYTNLEIILVDDGSPDGCPAICDEYTQKDPRIIVIHKENGGLSDARNAGLAIFQGDYVLFVDSDDWIPENAIEHLYSIASTHDAQLIIGANQRVYSETDTIHSPAPEMITTQTAVEAMARAFQNGCAAWARLYKRNIHESISFPVGEINEDEAIVLQILQHCQKVVETNAVVYCYNCRPESITTSAFSVKKLDWPKHCQKNLEWVRQHHPELEQDALLRLLGSLLWALREMALAEDDHKAACRYAKAELKRHFSQFKKLDLDKQQNVRLMLGRYAPFPVYKVLERAMAGRKH